MREGLPVQVARPLRIFLVENHHDTRKYMQMYLEGLGHSVQSAGTMGAALAALPGADCNVLISDIGLPDGDGWELLRRAKTILPYPIYAVTMSGFAMNADQERSRETGYRHHLLKPFQTSELESILEEAAREAEPGGKG